MAWTQQSSLICSDQSRDSNAGSLIAQASVNYYDKTSFFPPMTGRGEKQESVKMYTNTDKQDSDVQRMAES